MHVVDEREVVVDLWRDGVETRMYASAVSGAQQLTVFEQWCSPGNGAPLHRHAVEEVLRIVSGQAEVRVGDESAHVNAPASVIIPAGAEHGFTNTGPDTLQVLAVLAAPIFEARYSEPERDVRRWEPGTG